MLVTFTQWAHHAGSPKDAPPVSINPNEVVDVEDFCGGLVPGQRITLKNKKVYLVAGLHSDVVSKIEEGKKAS